MSFPRAKTKRFNDFVSDAPPPTAYDTRLDALPIGPASFLRGPRFRSQAAAEVGNSLGSAEDCSISVATTSAAPAAVRCSATRRAPTPGHHGASSGRLSVRPNTTPSTCPTGRPRERASASGSGCRQAAGAPEATRTSVSDQVVEPEMDAETGRLQPCGSCASSEALVASLHRELDQLRTASERDRTALVSDAERLRGTLAAREMELQEAQSSALAAEQALTASIDSSRACLSSLTEQLNVLQGECHLLTRREAEARMHAETLQGILDRERLRAEKEADGLRTRLDALMARFAASDDGNVTEACASQPASAEQCAKALQDYRDALEEENQELQRELKLLEVQRQQDADSIRALKGELFAADDYRRQAEDELLSLRADLADLCANIENLQESGVTNERALQVAHEERLKLREALDASVTAKAAAERDLADARAVLADALEQCKATDENLKQLQEVSAAERIRLLRDVEQLREQADELRQRVAEAERRDAMEAAAAAAAAARELELASAFRPASSADATSPGGDRSDDGGCAEVQSQQLVLGGDETAERTDRGGVAELSPGRSGECCSSSAAGQERSAAERPCSSADADVDAQAADCRLFELELQLAEAEADLQRAKADYESRLASSREAGAVLAVDCKYWRDMYEELHAKVSPFQEQLDAFEAERQALLCRSQHRADELAALSSAYAKLLGHQNQRQKIQHVVRIKEENRTLKKELESMREERDKLKRAMSARDDKIKSLEGRRRFDTSQAFKHGLDASTAAGDGDSVLKTPLKDCSNSLRTPKH